MRTERKPWPERCGSRRGKKAGLVLMTAATCAVLLSGCGVSKERLSAREEAIALFAQEDYEGAITAIDALLADASRVGEYETDLLKYRAEAEYRVGDYTAAAYTCEMLGKLEEPTAEFLYLKTAALAAAGEPEEAKEALLEAQNLTADGKGDAGNADGGSGYAEAALAVARAYVETGDTEEALAFSEELLSAAASDAVRAGLSKLLIEAGEYEKALSVLEETENAGAAAGNGSDAGAAAKNSGDAGASDGTVSRLDSEVGRVMDFNQAVCYEYLGQYEQALALFEQYVKVYGSDEQAEHEIAFLKTR